MAWGEPWWKRVERATRMRQQYPQLEFAQPETVMSVDKYAATNHTGAVSNFSQDVMSLGAFAAQQQFELSQAESQASDYSKSLALPDFGNTGSIYDQNKFKPRSPEPDTLAQTLTANKPKSWMAAAAQNALTTPLQALGTTSTLAGLNIPGSDVLEAATLGNVNAENLPKPIRSGIDLALNTGNLAFGGANAAAIGAGFGFGAAQSLAQQAGAPAPVILAAGLGGALVGSRVGPAAAGLGIKGALTYRDLTKNLPAGLSIKDVSGEELRALEAQVQREGGWNAQSIAKYQEITGRRPTASMLRSEESIIPPNTTAEGIRQGAGNAIVKNAGAANINLSNQIPLLRVFDALDQAKAVLPEQKANLSALRSRQAGAFEGVAGHVLGQGESGFKQATAALRGQAEQASYTPLRDMLDQGNIDAIYNEILQSNARPFERVQAGTVISKLLEGQPLTDSDFKSFEKVFGPEAMQQVRNRVSKLGGIEKFDWWGGLSSNPIRTVNDTIRAGRVFTLLDVGVLGRLGPTAGAYNTKNYLQALKYGAESLIKPKVIGQVLESLDQRAANTLADDGLSFIPNLQDMRDAGLRFGQHNVTDVDPGLLGKIPLIGRGARVDQAITTVLRPQMMQTTIENMVRSGKLTAEQARDFSVLEDVAKGINNIAGASNLRFLRNNEGTGELLLQFPNWAASQFELVARAFQVGSISGNMARSALTKLALLGTAYTAFSWLAQGKNPLDHIKDGIPQASIPGTDVTFNAYGPIGMVIQRAISLGKASYEGATPQGQQGGIDVLGGLGAAGSEAAWWGRSLASPLVGMGVDLMLGTDYLGNQIRDTRQHTLQYLARTPISFSAQNVPGLQDALGVKGRGVVADVLGEVGLRGIHTPSTTDRLTEAGNRMAQNGQLGMDAEIKKNFYDRPQSEQQAILDANPELEQRRTADRVSRGGNSGLYESFKVEQRNAQQDSDHRLDLPFGDPEKLSWDQWISDYRDRQQQAVGARAALKIGKDSQRGNTPTDQYYAQIEKATRADGTVDWDQVDAWMAGLSDTAQAEIDKETGLGGTEKVREYRTATKSMRQSGYYDLRDQAWEAFKATDQRLANLGDYWKWRDKEVQDVAAEKVAQGMNKDIALKLAADDVAGYKTVDKFNEFYRTQFRHQWVVDNPDLARQAWSMGLFDPDKAEQKFLLGQR